MAACTGALNSWHCASLWLEAVGLYSWSAGQRQDAGASPGSSCRQSYRSDVGRAQMRGAKPGILSEALRGALGMGETSPPPWLINMQRYGPPPSYPDLKVRAPPGPGRITREITHALGMGEASPPPWLINVQRYGPPPSYPDLKVCSPQDAGPITGLLRMLAPTTLRPIVCTQRLLCTCAPAWCRHCCERSCTVGSIPS